MSSIDALVEVSLNDQEDFLKVRETLTRIGVASRKDKKLFQSCHILHKQGKYYIVHFKELFKLDGKVSDFSDNDRSRRNAVVNLLVEWKLINVVRLDPIEIESAPMSQIKILSHKEKDQWELVPKYNIGRKK
jgi:hypothetical protein|tara:strand:+ start:6727 stop:7122 length:396 start_codon:yes stop_codon:yes gene_type:complete